MICIILLDYYLKIPITLNENISLLLSHRVDMWINPEGIFLATDFYCETVGVGVNVFIIIVIPMI